MKKIIVATLGMALWAVGFSVHSADAIGQGGISGTVAVAVDKNVSSAIAIGKNGAYSSGKATTATAVALSAGFSAAATMDGIYVNDLDVESSSNIEIAQGNTMSKDTIELNGKDNTAKGTVGTPQ